jgi:hypothetical protein
MPLAKPVALADYKAILLSHEREYRDARRADRQEIIGEIMEEMVAQSKGTLAKDTMKGLDQVSQLIQIHNPEISFDWTQKIQTWYGNHKSVSLEDESTLVRVGTVWNYRLVVQHLHKDDISSQMAKTGLTPSDPGWIKQFQLSVNKVIESLGGDDKVSEKYGEMAKLWNEVEPPEDLKRK